MTIDGQPESLAPLIEKDHDFARSPASPLDGVGFAVEPRRGSPSTGRA
jgi:hypothetical protein